MFLLAAVALIPQGLLAKKKEVKAETPKTAYQKLLEKPGVQSAKGFVNLYWIKDKVYMEIPQEIWGRRILTGTVVDKISNPQESAVGYCPAAPMEISFVRKDSLVKMLQAADRPFTSGGGSNAEALRKSFSDKILNQFSIKAYSPDSAAVIDITSYVMKNDDYMNPIDPKAYNSMDGWVKRKHSFKSDRSMLTGIAGYADNVSVSCSMGYDLSMSVLGILSVMQDIPFTAVMKRSFLLLPENNGYRRRQADARVGTGWESRTDFTPENQGSKTDYFVNRWNLTAERPLVFYMDTLLPDDWKEAVMRSAETWNGAFRKIGFQKALEVRPYPADASFDANSLSNSCIRYVLSPSGNITDNRWSDPQTGEILSANIYMPHNLASQIQLDALLQVSAFEGRARSLTPDRTLVRQVMQSLLLRSWGHCLGLTDNMAGSVAYPVDSLRSAAFVREHGLSASVMDVLPMNYLQDAGCYTDGMPLAQQVLGAYDEWALRYLYAPTGEKSETKTLRRWAAERNSNPLLLYKRPQSVKAYYDPRGMQKDLGNDAVRSATIAFRNLAYVVAHADAWLDKEDLDYEDRVPLYGLIINQADEYVKQVLQQVGGLYLNDTYRDDTFPAYRAVDKETQRASFRWMLDALQELSWMDNADLLRDCALTGSAADYAQKFFGNLIFIQLGNLWLCESKSDDPYTQSEAMADLTDFLFRESRAGKTPAEFKRFMQGRLLDTLVSWSNVDGNNDRLSSASSSRSLSDCHPYSGMKAIEGIAYMGTQGREPFWYGCLLDLRKEFQKAKSAAPTRVLRDEYEYRLFTLNKALEK